MNLFIWRVLTPTNIPNYIITDTVHDAIRPRNPIDFHYLFLRHNQQQLLYPEKLHHQIYHSI